MTLVPGGTFRTALARGASDAGPGCIVLVPSFWIDRRPVTREQYSQFMVAAKYFKSGHPEEPSGKSHAPQGVPADSRAQPSAAVVGVDWFDAYEFADRIGKRLPTEAELEWMAATATVARPGAGAPDAAKSESLPVFGQPTWEWTADRYDAAFYSGAALTSPAEGPRRVLHGGEQGNSRALLEPTGRLLAA